MSSTQGVVSESGGRLVLTKNDGSVGAALVRMTSPRAIGGDFDITVDFDLGTFPAAASGGGRYHTMILRDAGTLALVAGAARYREPTNSCIPFTDSYKFYTDNPGCTPSAVYVSTSDTTGKLRLNRQGATIRGYYWSGTAWVEAMNRTGPTGLLVLDFDSGTNGTLATGHTAYFDNLMISGGSCGSGSGGGSGIGGSSGAGGSGGAGGGAACLGNISIDFAALAPYWIDSSAACGSASASANALHLTRTGTCTSAQVGGAVTLDPSHWKLCGDFDVQVNFNLVAFTVPVGGTQTRYAVVRATDPSSTSGIALERYNAPVANPCPPSTQNYKGWSTTSTDCGGATMVATTDTTGKFRLTRVGSTVTSYYYSSAGSGSWVAVHTGTGITTTPWSLVFYTGYALGADMTDMSVTYSSLMITSSSAP
jgi:hypothetical protein